MFSKNVDVVDKVKQYLQEQEKDWKLNILVLPVFFLIFCSIDSLAVQNKMKQYHVIK